MGKVFIDAAVSIDGFWAGPDGNSIFPVEEMHRSGLMSELVDRTGSVVMSRRSFEMADPDWYSGNYEFQVPIHVFTDLPPARRPVEGNGLTFAFHDDFASALLAARQSAGEKDIAIIGERTSVDAALAADKCDEIYLRLVPTVCGGGERLMDRLGENRTFSIVSVKTTGNVVHMHLQRRDRAGTD